MNLSKWLLLVFAVGTALGGCAHRMDNQSGSATPTAVPSETAAARATPPTRTATPEPSGAISSSPVPTASALVRAIPRPAATRTIVLRPSNAPPEIYRTTLSQRAVSAGQIVSGSVLTSSNVASVEVRIVNYSFNMRKTGIGRFELAYTVPDLPFFLHRTYAMDIIARNVRGDSTTREFPITIR